MVDTLNLIGKFRASQVPSACSPSKTQAPDGTIADIPPNGKRWPEFLLAFTGRAIALDPDMRSSCSMRGWYAAVWRRNRHCGDDAMLLVHQFH
jgi:hypothetical protein